MYVSDSQHLALCTFFHPDVFVLPNTRQSTVSQIYKSQDGDLQQFLLQAKFSGVYETPGNLPKYAPDTR